MIVRLRQVFCLMPILAGFAFSASDASAETWSGPFGGSEGNPARSSRPASNLGVAWGSDATISSEAMHCVTYGGGTVFT